MDMKQLRQKVGLKAEEVAVKLGIAQSTVRNWEQGRTIPKLRIDQIGNLLRLYGCSFEELEQAIKNTKTEVEVCEGAQVTSTLINYKGDASR